MRFLRYAQNYFKTWVPIHIMCIIILFKYINCDFLEN